MPCARCRELAATKQDVPHCFGWDKASETMGNRSNSLLSTVWDIRWRYIGKCVNHLTIAAFASGWYNLKFMGPLYHSSHWSPGWMLDYALPMDQTHIIILSAHTENVRHSPAFILHFFDCCGTMRPINFRLPSHVRVSGLVKQRVEPKTSLTVDSSC